MIAPTQVIVQLHEKNVTVWTQQIGTSFRAYGVYCGTHVEGKGPNQIKAVADWRRNAVKSEPASRPTLSGADPES